jgi:NRAMP (natural resistance-associated macrophage protein)-like metal ion transporter
MKRIFEIALGIVTSVGGFLEIGSIATAAQGGADFSFQLIWAVLLGGLCVIFLVEQSGRMAAVSGRTIPDAIRERFGFNYFLFLYIVLGIVSLLVLAAEIGGVCVAIELASGIGFQFWAVPVALIIWLVIWMGTFGVIEKGISLLGLVTLCFVVGAVIVHPPWRQVAAGMVPTLPQHDGTHYWFIAVSILGASISPYLFFFYSSGAIEDEWNESYIGINRIIAASGMGFGTLISVAVLVLSAVLLLPKGIKVEHYSQLPLLLIPVFGRWGFWLVVASLALARQWKSLWRLPI